MLAHAVAQIDHIRSTYAHAGPKESCERRSAYVQGAKKIVMNPTCYIAVYNGPLATV